MITDNFLYEISKALNGDGYLIPAYLAVGTTDITAIDSADTSISGEIGTRKTVTLSRSTNTNEFSAIRSSTDVEDTVNGDNLESMGLFNNLTQSTSEKLLTGVALSGITQTTAFDIEFVVNLEVNRV